MWSFPKWFNSYWNLKVQTKQPFLHYNIIGYIYSFIPWNFCNLIFSSRRLSKQQVSICMLIKTKNNPKVFLNWHITALNKYVWDTYHCVILLNHKTPGITTPTISVAFLRTIFLQPKHNPKRIVKSYLYGCLYSKLRFQWHNYSKYAGI